MGFALSTWPCWARVGGNVPALSRREYATMNATSESLLYAGLFLPGDELATPAALMKLWRSDLRESGHLAYGLQYLDNPHAIALNPQHLPLRRESFALGPRLVREGGAFEYRGELPTDAEAEALYYNNIAMDALGRRELATAWYYLVQALQLSPESLISVECIEKDELPPFTFPSELGIKFPQSFSVATPESAATLRDLRNLTGNALLVTPLSATLNLKLEDTDTNVLASPRIRVRNREKAKIMIGSRVPVITNTVTPLTTGGAVTTGSVQYLDVGLSVEVEPDIHLDNEVVIKVNLDVSNIIKQVTNGDPETGNGTVAYEVGTRNANTVLRLKDGETQILAGLISDADRKSASKVPGLGQIPVLGRLFSNHSDDSAKTEIVLSITPRIVGSARLNDAREVEYWSGTGSGLRSSLFNLKPLGSVAVSTTAAARTAVRQQSSPRRTGR